MRSASSAGETITRGNQEVQISIPKRAETFNGASSSKENQMCSINFNTTDLLLSKSRMYSNNSSANQVNRESGGGSGSAVKASSNICSKLNNKHSNCSSSHANSEESGESGYHSRLCMDFNHDADASESCSCSGASYFESTQNNNMSEIVKLKSLLPPPGGSTTTTSISKTHFESILKFILTDYMRIKNENESLKKELDAKDRTIDQLRKAYDERKVRLNFNFV
jgi:hypothetical protein